MLDSLCEFLDGLGDVESVLSDAAYQGLKSLVRSVYGDHATKVLENGFSQLENYSWVYAVEDPTDSFLAYLQGRV